MDDPHPLENPQCAQIDSALVSEGLLTVFNHDKCNSSKYFLCNGMFE